MRDTKKLRKETLDHIELAEFEKINGIILRTMVNGMSFGWHSRAAFEAALKPRGISDEELIEALDFLEGYDIIKCRDYETKAIVEIADIFDEDYEIKLTSNGKMVAKGGIKYPGIDL